MKMFAWIVGGIVVVALVRGLVFSVLWGYWVVPLGVADIDLVEAIGLMGIYSMLSTSYATAKTPEQRKAVEQMGGPGALASRALSMAISSALVALVFGWVLHQFA